MSSYLLVFSIGPVQDFISAARRTRDLWFGSFLLSEISKATARAVQESGGKLIFPAPEDPTRLASGSSLRVANVILAEIVAPDSPQEIGKKARTAATACWQNYAKTAYEVAQPLISEEVWQDQTDDVIEFYAAWTPVTSLYREARQQVMRLLAGRKACRNFLPAIGRAGIPKSSLDGARETVLLCAETRDKTHDQRRAVLQAHSHLAQRLRLSAGEELDVIGVTKRTATKETFPSVHRVAADAWIRGVQRRKDDFSLIEHIADKCKGAGFATGTGDYYRKVFPYDGAVLYPSRLARMLRPQRLSDLTIGDFDNLLTEGDRNTLAEIKPLVEKLQKPPSKKGLGYGEPDPYVAILFADGDRVGKTISEIVSAQQHRQFSQQLAKFAGAAEQIVRSHFGCFVYSGGDDVLALLPVDQCLPCARQLHNQFGSLTMQWRDKDGVAPSLSVGIAIGHHMEPLEDLLTYGRDAERAAKDNEPQRNGLAVHLHARSGVPIFLRAQWSDSEDALDKRLEAWARLHRENLIPDKAAYDLRELLREYDTWPQVTDTQQQTLACAVRADALQMLKRKRGRKGDEGLNEITRLLSRISSLAEAHHVAEEILVARRLADIQLQASGIGIDTTTGSAA